MHLEAWVNPVLHGATAWVVATTANRLAGSRARVLAAVCYAFSPQALVLAASLMSHSLVAFCAALVAHAATSFVLAAKGEEKTWTFVACGAALGVTATTRPLCALALFLFTMGVVVYRRPPWRRVVAGLAPLSIALSTLLLYNHALTGHATRFPQAAFFDEHLAPSTVASYTYHPGCNDLGFGPGHGCESTMAGGAHSIVNALSNTGDNLGAWFLLVGGGGLAFLAAAYALVPRPARGLRVMLLAPTVAVILLYGLYWYAGTCYGARFYHAALPSLLLLAALGLDRVRSRAGLGIVLAAWLGYNAYALHRSYRELDATYWGTDARFARLEQTWSREPALVMIAFDRSGVRTPLKWTSPLVKGDRWLNGVRALSALGVNDPTFDGPVVFAKFHPALVAPLQARFPSRTLWLYEMSADAARDRLMPFDPSTVFDELVAPPPDNFDGFVLESVPPATH